MLLCPIQNTPHLLKQEWTQRRPRITQVFGGNAASYTQFGLAGHDGIDFSAPLGTPIFAPCDGEIRVKDDGAKGYGLHMKIRSLHGGREVVLAHLSMVVPIGDHAMVSMGDLLGYSGNTGNSTGPHLHMALRFLQPMQNKSIWQWPIKDYNNGYFGYVDFIEKLITFKGTLAHPSL